MRVTFAGLLTVLASAVLLGAVGVAREGAPASPSFTIAVLRRDGVIIPFASVDATRWRNHWAEPGDRHEIPVAVDDTPKGWWQNGTPSAAWTAWPVRGERQPIKALQVVNLTAQCQRHTGLKTDYRSAEPDVPPRMQPYPKDGLATLGDVTIERVEILDDQSPDWQKAIEAIAKPAAEAETKYMGLAAVTWKHPFSADQRARTPLALEALYRSEGAVPGRRHYYFEAVKRYPRNPWTPAKKGCDLLTYAVGWIDQERDAPMDATVTVLMSDCQREGLVYTMPLGAVRLDGGLFWIVQRAAWDYERYDVIEMARARWRVILKTPGGQCG